MEQNKEIIVGIGGRVSKKFGEKSSPKKAELWRNHPKLLGPGALIFVAKQL